MSHSPSLPSATPDSSDLSISPSAPRTTSLAAAAAMNAGLQRESTNEDHISRQPTNRPGEQPISPITVPGQSDRRRGSIAMNLSLNDPALPAPGEMQASSGAAVGSVGGTEAGSERRLSSRAFQPPSNTGREVRESASASADRSRSSSIANRQHGRQPSVGEVYQEMEQEQEAQVNRLLQTIRLQQQQLSALQSKSDPSHSNAISDHATGPFASSPTSERRPSFSFGGLPGSATGAGGVPLSPLATAIRSRRQSQTSPAPVRNLPQGYQLSHSMSSDQENAIVTPGQVTPALPTPTSSVSGATRDEIAFYQAECQNLGRENQMLKARIRELERQISVPTSPAANPSAPSLESRLSTEQSIEEEKTTPGQGR